MYADLCLISRSLFDGGVVIVDDAARSGSPSVLSGILRFLSETSTFVRDEQLRKDLTRRPTETDLRLSERIVRATATNKIHRCSRLVPFLYFYNKLFLTTPNFYAQYIQLIGARENFANVARDSGISYLEYHAVHLTMGNIPVWMDNHRLSAMQKADIFYERIENLWRRNLLTSDHFRFTD